MASPIGQNGHTVWSSGYFIYCHSFPHTTAELRNEWISAQCVFNTHATLGQLPKWGILLSSWVGVVKLYFGGKLPSFSWVSKITGLRLFLRFSYNFSTIPCLSPFYFSHHLLVLFSPNLATNEPFYEPFPRTSLTLLITSHLLISPFTFINTKIQPFFGFSLSFFFFFLELLYLTVNSFSTFL